MNRCDVLALFENYLSVPFQVLSAEETVCRQFEASFCFSPVLQPDYTATFLLDRLMLFPDRSILLLREGMGTCLILFRAGEQIVAAGPYVEDVYNEKKASAFFGGSAEMVTRYRLYRSGLGLSETNAVLRAVRTILLSDGIDPDLYEIREEGIGHFPDSQQHEEPVVKADDSVQKRYALERAFQEYLEKGMAYEAKSMLRRIYEAPRTGLRMHLWTTETSSAILRTMVRLAVSRSGLPALIIDSISQDYAQRMQHAGLDYEEANRLTFQMIDELCREIRKMQIQQYAQLTQKVIFRIRQNPEDDFSVGMLAKEFQVSESTLQHTIKADTGVSVKQLISQERCQQAVRMLIATQDSIQLIAAHVGYPDSNYFVKVFRQQYGQTPSAYRKQYGIH